MSKATIKYELYAMEATMENIAMVQKERFYRITPTYILFYKKKCRKKGEQCYNKIGESELGYLTEDDIRWLEDCNVVLLAEDVVKHREEITADMGSMVDRLEKALREEKAKHGQS